jgi:DNA-binding GntR family transcriptional regulator
MSMPELSSKARAALAVIESTRQSASVTRQMIDRLARDRFIDFDSARGWYVTEFGLDVLKEEK